ncbi:MAG: SRPBCC family protein [Massilia sp.]
MADVDADTTNPDHELVISGKLNASRERVFDAFTDRQHIGQWWGPNGFSSTIDEMDVREGGAWRFTMHGPDGADYRNRIDYTDIKRPERLCYEHGDDISPYFRTEITFVGEGDATVVSLRMLCKTPEQLAEMKKFGAVEGGTQTLERLGRYLAGYGGEM